MHLYNWVHTEKCWVHTEKHWVCMQNYVHHIQVYPVQIKYNTKKQHNKIQFLFYWEYNGEKEREREKGEKKGEGRGGKREGRGEGRGRGEEKGKKREGKGREKREKRKKKKENSWFWSFICLYPRSHIGNACALGHMTFVYIRFIGSHRLGLIPGGLVLSTDPVSVLFPVLFGKNVNKLTCSKAIELKQLL